jgi:dystroglycan 1
LSNGQCKCKPDVIGNRCDQCPANSFHLNARTGCINCFCMGVTNDCTSTSYYRDTVRASFASPQSDFALVAGYENAVPVASRLNVRNNEVSFRQFAVNDDTYYWSLPSR